MQVSVAEWLACLTAVWEDPGSNHAADSCVHQPTGWVIITMAMVDVDGSCQFSADSQPESIGLVWGLAATRRSVCIHQMNRVNYRNDFGCDASTINIVVAIVTVIVTITLLRGDWKCETWKYGTVKNAGVENARHEFAAPDCRVENAGKVSMESQSVKKCLRVVVFVCRVIPSV